MIRQVDIDNLLQETLLDEGAKDHLIHLHCFRRTVERVRPWISRFPNLMVGFTPRIENREVVREVPLTRILLETDAPYFTPYGKARPSKPWYVMDTAREISQIKETPLDQILCTCFDNAYRFYNLQKFGVFDGKTLNSSCSL